MKRWTLGFIFTPDFSHILLIHKQHPVDQAGKWNGIGGKFEEGESIFDCISRETKEESDLSVTDWREVGSVSGIDWEMFVCAAVYSKEVSDARTMTDEEVKWFPTNAFPSDKHNLRWLVPLCVDALKRDEIDTIEIRYTSDDRWR